MLSNSKESIKEFLDVVEDYFRKYLTDLQKERKRKNKKKSLRITSGTSVQDFQFSKKSTA